MTTKKRKAEPEKPVYGRRLIYAVIAVILVLSGVFVYRYLPRSSQPKAAIIDQLGSSQLSDTSRHENETFVETAKDLLGQRFPAVDYYSDNATVEQYKRLPSLGYKLIIWRAHSALDAEHFIAISTSERYVPGKYTQYSEDQLKLSNITDDPYLYYAITPAFVSECMNGRFEDTVILFMSCNGLKTGYYETAETFIEKGAKVFVSWDNWIDPSDNDDAATRLLQYLINDNKTVGDAVNAIPWSYSTFGTAKLSYYPSGVADYRIPDYTQNSATSNLESTIIAASRKARLEYSKFELD
jgi:hypothetical protein